MIDFVVHDADDSVGVVVVEGVKAGAELTGWVMDQDEEIKFTAASDVPIGHKVSHDRRYGRFPFGLLVPGNKYMAKFPFGHIVPGHKHYAKFPFGHIVPGHKYMANWIWPHTKPKAG